MLNNCLVIVISCSKDKKVSQYLLINTFSHISLYMYNKKAVLNRFIVTIYTRPGQHIVIVI